MFLRKMFSSRVSEQGEFRHAQSGFSLLEILIGLTLIATLGTIVATAIFDNFHEGNVKSAKIQMGQLEAALKDYRRHCNRYPTTEQGLEALLQEPSSDPKCKRYRSGGYLGDEDSSELPVDPWGNEFDYTSDGRKFVLRSYGQDGEDGGEEKDSDVYLRDSDAPNQGEG